MSGATRQTNVAHRVLVSENLTAGDTRACDPIDPGKQRVRFRESGLDRRAGTGSLIINLSLGGRG